METNAQHQRKMLGVQGSVFISIIYLFFYSGLCWVLIAAWAISSCSVWGYARDVHRLLISEASPVAELELSDTWFQ